MTRRGFTLLEMIVAAALILALVGAMATFLSDALRIRSRVSEEIERARSADAAVSMIERALETTIVEDASAGGGVVGDSTSMTVLRVGLSSWRLGTSERVRALDEIEPVRVRFDEGRRRIAIARGERPESELLGAVQRMRFRYFDGTVWSDRFDSVRLGRLPAAVEIALWLRPMAEASAEPAERPEFDDSPVPASEESGPKPDRIRIVAIPDAGPDDPDALNAGGGGTSP
jgi:prepilin-type N-terminal cleavage/methylation domain-containing protein